MTVTPTSAQVDAAVAEVHAFISAHTSFDYTKFLSATDLRSAVTVILTAGMSVPATLPSANQPLSP